MKKRIRSLKGDASTLVAQLLISGIPFDIVTRDTYFVIATDKYAISFSEPGELLEVKEFNRVRRLGTSLNYEE